MELHFCLMAGAKKPDFLGFRRKKDYCHFESDLIVRFRTSLVSEFGRGGQGELGIYVSWYMNSRTCVLFEKTGLFVVRLLSRGWHRCFVVRGGYGTRILKSRIGIRLDRQAVDGAARVEDLRREKKDRPPSA
jgi:hypothetical protein